MILMIVMAGVERVIGLSVGRGGPSGGNYGAKLAKHGAECGETGRLLPSPSFLRLKADLVGITAEDLGNKMDEGERNAHISAAGPDPGSFDTAAWESEISFWLPNDLHRVGCQRPFV